MATSKKKKSKTSVPARAKPTDLAKLDYGDDEGGGYEGQTKDDIAMPFLAVLQPLSPQVTDKTVKGAKAGLLFNTVTEELSESITFVPSCTKHVFVEWVPRKQGGGYVAEHEINSPVVAKAKAEAEEFNKLHTPEGNDLVETYYIFGVLTDGDEPAGFITIACSSTMIKVYKRFNTRLQTFMLKRKDGTKQKPPLFAHHSRITVTSESNAEGKWFNMAMAPADEDIAGSLLPKTDPRYQAASECRELVQSGVATPAYDGQKQTPGGGDDDGTVF